jgi:hypothetical protein
MGGKIMAKGKNFSRNNASGKRIKDDNYSTPLCLTTALIEYLRLDYGLSFGRVLEPACGEGAIVKALNLASIYGITHYDKETDFLKETKCYDTIITNPPYCLSFEFIEKALHIACDSYLLLPLTYLQGSKRFHAFYKMNRLAEIFVFNRYPFLGEPLREDGKIKTGMQAYAWFHFSNRIFTRTQIHWLDIDPYILRKKDKAPI